MKTKLRKGIQRFSLLLRSVPPIPFALFFVSVFAMNLLANKSLSLRVDWLALDAGILVSWVAFLSMDMLTRRFGPKAATQLSLFTIALNLLGCLVLFVASRVPGVWGAYYDFGEADVINRALDSTFGGTWYVVLGSALAFAASAFVNNFSNWAIGKGLRRAQGFGAYALRSYLSTALGQFCDNLLFAFCVSLPFFGWSALQCVTCAVTGMVVELACEVIFSPLGYYICKKWDQNGVGKEYLLAQEQAARPPEGGAQ